MQNLATYNSMLYNVNLTRTAWNQSYKDSILLENDKFIINTHPFACPHCLEHQGKIYTRQELEDIVGIAVEDGAKEILHPNCKCEIAFYEKGNKLKRLNKGKLTEQYHVREQVMSLELKKEQLQSDKAIYKRLDSQSDIDNVNNQIKKINSSIKELTSTLPTASLKKQAVAR